MSGIRFESLNWDGNFRYPNMVRVFTIGDGSCLFHGVISSFFSPYRKGELSGRPLDRRAFVLKFRQELADKLAEPASPGDPSISWYQLLSRGQLPEFSRTVPEFSLPAMQAELRSGGSVDNKYNELLSEILNKDIYLLSSETKDLYITGNDSDILFKDRDSIVILYNRGHYEVVGVRDPSNSAITLLFKPDDPFIESIRTRMREIHKY